MSLRLFLNAYHKCIADSEADQVSQGFSGELGLGNAAVQPSSSRSVPCIQSSSSAVTALWPSLSSPLVELTARLQR